MVSVLQEILAQKTFSSQKGKNGYDAFAKGNFKIHLTNTATQNKLQRFLRPWEKN
jgi:hypothetical protein